MNLIYRNSFLDNRHSYIKIDKSPLTSNTNNIKLDNRSIISDATYNLFKKSKKHINKNYNKIKIKKIETPFINKDKHRSKTTNLRTYTDCSSKNKNKNFNLETLQNKKLNKVNSIIININNSQYNKTSFRNKTNERISINDNNERFFYDFSLNKIKIKENEFKSKINIKNNYNNTYNKGKKNNNCNAFHKKKIKLNKNNIKEKLNFNLSQKKPIKINSNLIDNKIKNKSYIQKNKNSNFDKSFNNDSKNNNQLHKTFYSRLFNMNKHNITMPNNEKKYLTHKKKKSAEKNYLEKWQKMNDVNFKKKYSLSYVNSNKQITIIPKQFKNLLKNSAFSQRQRKTTKNIYFKDNDNIKVMNIYNNTEINGDNKTEDRFLHQIQNNNKKQNYFEMDKMNTENEINNDNIIEIKLDQIESLNKIIERKKREIDLLNIMKFTSNIYNSDSFNKNNKDINKNTNINKSFVLNNKNNNRIKDFDYESKLYFNYKDEFLNYNEEDRNNDKKNYSYLNYNNEINEENNNYSDLASIINIDSTNNNKF